MNLYFLVSMNCISVCLVLVMLCDAVSRVFKNVTYLIRFYCNEVSLISDKELYNSFAYIRHLARVSENMDNMKNRKYLLIFSNSWVMSYNLEIERNHIELFCDIHPRQTCSWSMSKALSKAVCAVLDPSNVLMWTFSQLKSALEKLLKFV